jgi:hypothetical protein
MYAFLGGRAVLDRGLNPTPDTDICPHLFVLSGECRCFTVDRSSFKSSSFSVNIVQKTSKFKLCYTKKKLKSKNKEQTMQQSYIKAIATNYI